MSSLPLRALEFAGATAVASALLLAAPAAAAPYDGTIEVVDTGAADTGSESIIDEEWGPEVAVVDEEHEEDFGEGDEVVPPKEGDQYVEAVDDDVPSADEVVAYLPDPDETVVVPEEFTELPVDGAVTDAVEEAARTQGGGVG